MDSNTNQLCDTLPSAKLAAMASMDIPETLPHRPSLHASGLQPPPTRKLCVRHERMADEGTNTKLQQSLDKLPVQERQAVNAIWSNFSSSSHPRRALILQGLLTMCCFSQLSLLTEHLAHLIRIDPFAVLPPEVCLRILGYLDATSLCRASQISRLWRKLADDDALWKGICEQHIGQHCHKCGWGLPVLEKRRYIPGSSPVPSSSKRSLDDEDSDHESPNKRHKSEEQLSLSEALISSSPCRPPSPSSSCSASITRPWKDVYCERMTVERNWRRGRCTVRILKGHTDGVMCLQFDEGLTPPSFPILMTGSYDRTVRVWNLETGAQIHVLQGHERAVRALQFDKCKLITGSLDCTLKVWDWRRGLCVRTLTGHTGGVVALNFDNNVLASGSVDCTVKVWNLRTGGAFTLRGHQDWVNAVQLWDSNPYYRGYKPNAQDVGTETGRSTSPWSDASHIDPGKMLFSGSDDGTMRLWDLTTRTCVRVFSGHVGQVQSMKLLIPSDCDTSTVITEDDEPSEDNSSSPEPSTILGDANSEAGSWPLFPNPKKPVLISGSLDNTIKMWDVDTGAAVRTFFGHIEGIWGVGADKLRLASGSQDRTIKLWSRDTTSATATLVGHRGAVCCLQVGEDKIVSGSDDSEIRVWSFCG